MPSPEDFIGNLATEFLKNKRKTVVVKSEKLLKQEEHLNDDHLVLGLKMNILRIDLNL